MSVIVLLLSCALATLATVILLVVGVEVWAALSLGTLIAGTGLGLVLWRGSLASDDQAGVVQQIELDIEAIPQSRD